MLSVCFDKYNIVFDHAACQHLSSWCHFIFNSSWNWFFNSPCIFVFFGSYFQSFRVPAIVLFSLFSLFLSNLVCKSTMCILLGIFGSYFSSFIPLPPTFLSPFPLSSLGSESHYVALGVSLGVPFCGLQCWSLAIRFNLKKMFFKRLCLSVHFRFVDAHHWLRIIALKWDSLRKLKKKKKDSQETYPPNHPKSSRWYGLLFRSPGSQTKVLRVGSDIIITHCFWQTWRKHYAGKAGTREIVQYCLNCIPAKNAFR